MAGFTISETEGDVSTFDLLTPDGEPARRRLMRAFALVGLLLPIATFAVAKHAQATTQGWISTCAGVGCHGGQVGCYWYQARGLELIMYCYGIRP